jgi:hypothetical protein
MRGLAVLDAGVQLFESCVTFRFSHVNSFSIDCLPEAASGAIRKKEFSPWRRKYPRLFPLTIFVKNQYLTNESD